MALTNAITFRNNTILVSTNTTTFTDISAWSNSIKVSGGSRNLATEFFFGQDTAVILAGKRDPITLEITIAYTEAVTDPFELFIRPAYETSTPTPLYFKWSPRGAEVGTTGEFVYATDPTQITDPPYPQGDAKGDAIVTFAMKGTCSFITKSTSAT
jgi:hypothetical protein